MRVRITKTVLELATKNVEALFKDFKRHYSSSVRCGVLTDCLRDYLSHMHLPRNFFSEVLTIDSEDTNVNNFVTPYDLCCLRI